MKVRLTELRFMNRRRYYPGDVVAWPDGQPLGRGMKLVSDAKPVEAAEAPVEALVEESPKRGRPRKSDAEVL